MQRGRLRFNEGRRTNLADVWAGGDCFAGPDLTVVAVQDGKIAGADERQGESGIAVRVQGIWRRLPGIWKFLSLVNRP